MHSYAILGLASLASLASAAIVPGGSQFFPANGLARRNETVTTTKVVEAYTTYCPEPTTFELGGKTYTVEEPTTLTITECPCTIVEPCYTCAPAPTGTGTPPGPSPPNPGPPGPPGPPAPPGTTSTPEEEPVPPPMTGAAAGGKNGVALVGAAVFGLLAL